MTAPLDGIKVLDFTRYQQGPFATTILPGIGIESKAVIEAAYEEFAGGAENVAVEDVNAAVEAITAATTPATRPVAMRSSFVLSRKPVNCVNPSMASGVNATNATIDAAAPLDVPAHDLHLMPARMND